MDLTSRLAEVTNVLSDLLFPPSCASCGAGVEDWSNSSLCTDCQESIPEIHRPFCERCGLPVLGLIEKGAPFCGACLSGRPAFGRTRYGVAYEGIVRDMVVGFKFGRALHLGQTLSELLVRAFHRHFHPREFDLIVPIPVHRRRLIRRGFNQAAILAEAVSRFTGIPIDRTSLHKTRDTVPQVGLPRRRRLENLRGSFGISHPDKIRGRRILIVDDVATTGTTVKEASGTLMRGKAASVDALLLALRLDPAHRSDFVDMEGIGV